MWLWSLALLFSNNSVARWVFEADEIASTVNCLPSVSCGWHLEGAAASPLMSQLVNIVTFFLVPSFGWNHNNSNNWVTGEGYMGLSLSLRTLRVDIESVIRGRIQWLAEKSSVIPSWSIHHPPLPNTYSKVGLASLWIYGFVILQWRWNDDEYFNFNNLL